ncbi:hypothetical protein WN73_15275 [Bradyrhizobium sp. CCBAU 45394]|nr:hypothetical protein [Bradyrhizobium sp. CCBAU 45394]
MESTQLDGMYRYFDVLETYMNYIFPLLAVAITIGLFVRYAMVRQSLRRSRPTNEVPHWPDSSFR